MANVFKEAKKLQRAFPRKYADWQKAVKAAGKKIKKSGSKKRRVGAVKFIEKKENTRTRPRVYRVSRTKSGTFKKIKSIGQARTTVQGHLKAAREGLGEQLGDLQVKQILAPTKTEKKKIAKRVAELKRQISRLK